MKILVLLLLLKGCSWKTPEHGDKRVITKFALIPKTLSNKTTVWLRSYTAEEIYTVNGPNVGPSFPDFWWIERKPAWIEKKTYLNK